MTVLIPEEEFIACTGSDAAIRAFLDAASGAEEALQQYLEEIVLAEDSALLLRSVLDLKASFVHFLNKYYFVGGALAIVLALIGIMNFYNMTAASVLSRKRELVLLETVGMTKKQLRRMLVTEGCLYLSGAFMIALVITVLFGGRMLTAALGHAFFFEIKVTVLPTIVLLPVLFMIACLVPTYQFGKMGKESDRDKL